MNAFWSLSPSDIFRQLDASPNGLTSAEAIARLARARQGKKNHPEWWKTLRLFFRQFASPLILLLLFASFLSAALGNWHDSLILASILLLSGTLGFWQEYSAGRAVEKLRSMMHSTSVVVREGREMTVPKDTIVAGDIVLFKAGDLVPADCLLLRATDLHANESALTGESFPIEKQPGTAAADAPLAQRFNALFEGSSVMSGTATAVAVHTGQHTEFGAIQTGMEGKEPETAFHVGFHQFGVLLLRLTFLFSAGILILNLFLGKPFAASILFSTALAVGLAPELLPAIMVATLAAGARRMAQDKVIVKRLDAIQNLGAVNILCSDKTGTLTTGEARVAKTLDALGQHSSRVALYAYLNAVFESGFTNPIDEAIRRLPGMDATGFSKRDEVPYDFERKRLSIVVRDGGRDLMITKGALSNILGVCTQVEMPEGIQPIDTQRGELQRLFESFSADGYRVIGLAWKDLTGDPVINRDDEVDMIFLGFLLLEDPPKPGIRGVVDSLAGLGVSLKIITGDNRLAAAHFAGLIGLDPARMLIGSDLETLDDTALSAKAFDTTLFAEIEPRQKERLVRVLQSRGDVVGFIGDGINDAPALKTADVGISVDSAMDVAKEAADFVLLERNLEVLRKGILDGRKTYLNTLKYIFITTSANFGNMFSLAGISLVLKWLPLLPAQILLLNFLSDIPALAIASDNVDEEQLAKPRRWDVGLIRRFMVYFGIMSSLFDYLTFGLLLLVFHAGERQFQSGWFVESLLTEIIVLLLVRTARPALKSRPSAWVLRLSALTVAGSLVFMYSPWAVHVGIMPLPPVLLAAMAGMALLYGVLVEVSKKRFFSKM